MLNEKNAAPSRFRPKVLGVPLGVWLAMLAAGVAVAAFVSLVTTTQSNFTAGAVGDVVIGDATTVALFNLSAMQPGDTAERCLRVEADQRGVPAGNGLRMYSDGVTGDGLEGFVLLDIEFVGPFTGGFAAGILADCSGVTGTTSLFSGTLTAWDAASPDYTSGVVIDAAAPAGINNKYDVKFVVTLPDTPAVNNTAQGLTASAAWTFEGR